MLWIIWPRSICDTCVYFWWPICCINHNWVEVAHSLYNDLRVDLWCLMYSCNYLLELDIWDRGTSPPVFRPMAIDWAEDDEYEEASTLSAAIDVMIKSLIVDSLHSSVCGMICCTLHVTNKETHLLVDRISCNPTPWPKWGVGTPDQHSITFI